MHARAAISAILPVLTLASAGLAVESLPVESPKGDSQAAPIVRAHIVVFDFATEAEGSAIGKELADSVRLRLARHADCEVIDVYTTRRFSPALAVTTEAEQIEGLMSKLAANVAVWGTVNRQGQAVAAVVRCLEQTDPASRREWTQGFADRSQRARAVIARQIVEAIRGRAEWRPPEYGDQTEPANFSKPLNVNGGFEQGSTGWEAADNVSTFIGDGPPGRGKVLRVRTDLKRDRWLAYRRALMLGQADPNNPPAIPADTSYGSVAGLEGVHFRSDWIRAEPGRRYWLTADVRPPARATSKVFIKGYRDMAETAEGLPERSLVELGLSPEQFATLPEPRQKEIIAKDAAVHGERYRREVYRWYLPCRSSTGEWNHFAAPLPPRGGLPEQVQWLQIQVYAYWPPGEYLFDNVMLYADPTQRDLLPEEPPRSRKVGGQPAQ